MQGCVILKCIPRPNFIMILPGPKHFRAILLMLSLWSVFRQWNIKSNVFKYNTKLIFYIICLTVVIEINNILSFVCVTYYTFILYTYSYLQLLATKDVQKKSLKLHQELDHRKKACNHPRTYAKLHKLEKN